MNIFIRELRANLKSLVTWSFIIMLLILMSVAKFSAFAGDPELLKMLDSMPPALLDALSMRGFNLTTLSGFYGVMFIYFGLMSAIASAMWGSDMISKEERDKTVEFSLVLPVSRSRVITKLPKTESIMDVGTGGGFPLLPLALLLPEARCVGMDSIGKKIAAIQRIVDAMKIPNVTLIAERAEILGQDKKHREKYDVVTSRAVAPLNVLLEWVSPFCKVGGHIVLWKSLNIEQELKDSEKAQRILHCPLLFTQQYTLEKDFGTRQLLVFRKNDQLVKEYPREIGMAKRMPLL